MRVICGHFGGISTSLNVGELNNIGDLGIISQLRGRDSTGIACFKHRKKKAIYSRTMKATDNSSNFLYSRDVLREMYGNNDRPFCVIGHCRAATQGEVSPENAHPFTIKHIVGAHNGTIADIRGKTKDGTDSEAFFTILAKEGLQAAVNAAKGGAYALVWADLNKQTLNFLRNAQRPFFYCVSRGVIYWASELEMIKLVMARDNQYNAEIKVLEIDTHMEIDLHYPVTNQIKRDMRPEWSMATYQFKEVLDKTEEKIEKTDIKSTTTVMGPLNNPLAWEKPRTETSVPVTTGPRSPYENTSAKYRGFRNKTMDIHKAQRLLREGCAHCTAEVTVIKENEAFWYNNKQYLCKDCVKSVDARELVNATKVWPGRITIEGAAEYGCQGTC